MLGCLFVGVPSYYAFKELLFPDLVTLSGPVPNVWAVPAFSAPPTVLPGTTWASIPARGSDGSVAGLVDDKGEGKFVVLHEGNGSVRWQISIGPMPSSFLRTEKWAPRASVPNVPLTLRGPSSYLVAWARTWLLVADSGTSFKIGEFPAAVPPTRAYGGVCLVDEGFWIAVDDGRNGGIVLSAAGVPANVRSDRPTTCPGAGTTSLYAISPQQNAHAILDKIAPADSSGGYPNEVCSRQKGKSRSNEFCSDMRSDGPSVQAAMLMAGGPVFRDGSDWQLVRLPIPDDGVDFSPRIVGYELAFPRAFFDMVEYRFSNRENNPAPGSFESKQVEPVTEVVEIVASISRAGRLEWARTVRHGASARVSNFEFADTIADFRSLLFASHPSSPTQNLYIFKPGMLLAVDQMTGEPRFQIGIAVP